MPDPIQEAYETLDQEVRRLDAQATQAAADLARDPTNAELMGALLDTQAQLKAKGEQRTALDAAVAAQREAAREQVVRDRIATALESRDRAYLLSVARLEVCKQIDDAIEALHKAVAAYQILSREAASQHDQFVGNVPSDIRRGRPDNGRAQVDPGGGAILPTVSYRLSKALRGFNHHGLMEFRGFVNDSVPPSVEAAGQAAAARYRAYTSDLTRVMKATQELA